MQLEKLLKNVEILKIVGDTKLNISNICYDSRKVKKSDMFICIKGFEHDGHLFIEEAIERGATVIVVEEEHKGTVLLCCDNQIRNNTKEPSSCVPCVSALYVEDTRKAMAEIANNFYDSPSSKLKLVGITGTNGKTSVSYMLMSILKEKKAGLIGTISYTTGKGKKTAQRTTPESLDLNELLNDMVVNNMDTCVMEVSSHSLELDRVWEIDFNIGVFTNLSSEHLDFHGSLEKYKNAKKKLFTKTNQFNVINADDNVGKEIVKEFNKYQTPILTYGLNNSTDIMAKNINLTNEKVEFELITPKFNRMIKINTPGLFTVYNALAAISSAYALGISETEIINGINNFQGVPGRFMRLREFSKFTVIIDYAHTPDGLLNVLNTIEAFKKNNIITVFGCGGDRDKEKRSIMGNIAGRISDFTIITSDNPRTEKAELIALQIEEGIKETVGKYEIIINRKEAISYAIKHAKVGDTILIAGKGHETTQIIGDEIVYFNDAETAILVGRDEGII
ncbi:MAG: UDP-N-acetylmuramoyl-L-alanyl-D-glutamate--2,6-diaminopimelate ligase [Alkaliphilus sp.]